MAEKQKKKAERSLWTDDEITKLLAIWGEDAIQQQLDGTTRNSKVFSKIAEKLGKDGVKTRTAVQCREKLKSLKKEYKKVKDHNRNQSGGARKTFQFYDLIDRVMGLRHIIEPPVLHDTAAEVDQAAESTTDEDDSGSTVAGNTGTTLAADDADLEEDLDSSGGNEDSLMLAEDTDDLNVEDMPAPSKQEPPKKKQKTTQENRLESLVNHMMSSFKEQQQGLSAEMIEWDMKRAAAEDEKEKRREEREEQRERLRVEMEEAREERRRRADQEHEMRMMGMLGQLLSQFRQPNLREGDIHVENDGTSYRHL